MVLESAKPLMRPSVAIDMSSDSKTMQGDRRSLCGQGGTAQIGCDERVRLAKHPLLDAHVLALVCRLTIVSWKEVERHPDLIVLHITEIVYHINEAVRGSNMVVSMTIIT